MIENGPAPSVAASTQHGRFVAVHALLWCFLAPLLGIAAARAALWVEHLCAPLLIFPLLVGCGVGLALAALMRLTNVGHRATIMAGAALAVVPAIVGQHYFSYRDARAALLAKNDVRLSMEQFQEIAPPVASSFLGYMQRQARLGRAITADYSLRGDAAWASWGLDGLLLAASAVIIVYVFSRQAYCNVCHSWYRTVRSGRLDSDAALRLADTAALPLSKPIAAVHYRLSHCVSGCGPACLVMTWDAPRGSAGYGSAWLAADTREAVVRALDEASVRRNGLV